MRQMPVAEISFNLWSEPWIPLERLEGGTELASIERVLLEAHCYAAIEDTSPLVVVGIHRLLAAILQGIINPRSATQIRQLWDAGRFAETAVEDFGRTFSHRFDLFSQDAPFLQSADLPLQPEKGAKTKSVAYLAPEIPTGTAVVHFRHGRDEEHLFCPVCLAGCLVAKPAFATLEGREFRPSINGVPPIYVIPGGRNVFESLALSLVLPDYLPQVRAHKRDDAWWKRAPHIGHSEEISEVGYLHSLTFPARRLRLHPQRIDATCTRCGRGCTVGVRTMVYEMGESRPKQAPIWFDPFVAYRLPEKGAASGPVPVRPASGKVLWREFAALFLQNDELNTAKKRAFRRPMVLSQIAELRLGGKSGRYAFRCVGIRTDKAKVFEWMDAGFEVAPRLLRDDENLGFAEVVSRAVRHAEACAAVLSGTFKSAFARDARKGKGERHRAVRTRMIGEYWSVLAEPFRSFVIQLAEQDREARQNWAEQTLRTGVEVFRKSAEAVGDDGPSLRMRMRGEHLCALGLGKKRKEYLNE